jgi:hypothetical protein
MDNFNPPPPPLPPPARWTKGWFRAKCVTWWSQPRSQKWVQVLFFLFSSVIILQYSWKFFWGLFYYAIEYIKVALGHDVLTEPCVRIMKEVYPWRHLEKEEYWRWNRCVGNEAGFQGQGHLVPTTGGAVAWLLNPYAFASWVVSTF